MAIMQCTSCNLDRKHSNFYTCNDCVIKLQQQSIQIANAARQGAIASAMAVEQRRIIVKALFFYRLNDQCKTPDELALLGDLFEEFSEPEYAELANNVTPINEKEKR